MALGDAFDLGLTHKMGDRRTSESPLVARGDSDRSIRVLIVEDDPRVRAALRSFLSACPGFEVAGDAADAAAALELARERAPAVVLLDVLLPGAREGLGLLRVLAGEVRLPVVAMSIDGELSHSAVEAGAFRFLDKTSAPELLPAALREAAVAGGGLAGGGLAGGGVAGGGLAGEQ
jgi:CheY-like chemotaxis protein